MNYTPLDYDEPLVKRPDMARVYAYLGKKIVRHKKRLVSTRDDKTSERSIWAGRPFNYVAPRMCASFHNSGVRDFSGSRTDPNAIQKSELRPSPNPDHPSHE